MLLSAYCLLPTDCKRRDHIEEVGLLFDCLVETFSSSFPLSRDPADDLRICPGLAMGLHRTDQTLPALVNGNHFDHVDDLLFG